MTQTTTQMTTQATWWRAAARARGLAYTLAYVLLVATGVAGCGDLLEVPDDPTRVEEADLDDATGAELLRRSALRTQATAVANAAYTSGVFTDEFLIDGAPLADLTREPLDRRQSELYLESGFNSQLGGPVYEAWQTLRKATSVALPRLKTYAPPAVRGAYVGQMLALRGHATLRLAEQVCPGFPLHEIVDNTLHYGAPHSTEQALERALIDFDSAVVAAVDSARILHFARVGRARTLLDLGRFAEAGAAVAEVPTAFTYAADIGAELFRGNQMHFTYSPTGDTPSVADQEGGNGLAFIAADDPRVETEFLGLGRDGVTELYRPAKYPTELTPIVMASGIEARLIEAEAALQADDPAWLTILNELRATQVTPALAPLADPGTDDARVDLLYRERAFWLYATGSRLGDLRRLIRLYGRNSESVFPTGDYRRGFAYGEATSIPFGHLRDMVFNPAVTGCTSL